MPPMDPPLLIVWQVSFFPVCPEACFVIVKPATLISFFVFFLLTVPCGSCIIPSCCACCSCFHYYILSNHTVSGLKARCAVSGKGYRSFRAKGQCRSAIGGQGPRGDSPYAVCPVPCVDRPIILSLGFFFFFFFLPCLSL